MNRLTKTAHNRTRRSSFRWETLETRCLLSGGTSIWTLNPQTPTTLGFLGAGYPNILNLPQYNPNAPAATINGSPTALNLGFSSPTAFFVMPGDVDLQEFVNGTWSSILTPLSQLNATPDFTSVQLVPGTNLGNGLYRLVLPAFTDFNSNPTDETFAEFQVALPQSVSLGDAIKLGTIGPNVSDAKATLNFQTNPTDVKLYQFSLPAGHFWQLGSEIDSTRDNGSLRTAISLFDSQGNVIASSIQGRPDFPKDPYLFTGLQPGTYYIGVSSVANPAGGPVGYSPKTGVPGVIDSTQKGGFFTLDLVADPADKPTSLINFNVDRADPNSGDPTGFTLQFSSALAVGDPLTTFQNGIQVVDQNGKVFGATPVSYDESTARVSFLFNDTLPQGNYSVMLSNVGLKDLAGRRPIAPGKAEGVLGTFQVGPQQVRSPLDLGALLPTPAVQWLGLNRTLSVDSGQTVQLRFVVVFPGTYNFYCEGNGPFSVSFASIHGVSSALGSSNEVNDQRFLQPGVYAYQITSLSSVPVQMQWDLGTKGGNFDNLLLNGVGFGPALNLRLIDPTSVYAPTPTSPSPSPAPAPSSPPSSPSATPIPSPTPSGGFYSAIFPTPAPTEPNGGSPASPSSFGNVFGGINSFGGLSQPTALTAGGKPVGLPTAQSDHIAAVGSNAPGTDIAAAGTPIAILQALVKEGDIVSPLPEDEPAVSRKIPNRSVDPETDGSIVFESAAPAVSFEGNDRSEHGGGLPTEWFDRLRLGFDDFLNAAIWKNRSTVDRRQEAIARLDPTSPAIAPIENDSGRERERLNHAALVSPIGLGLGSLVLLHAHRRRRLRSASSDSKASSSSDRSRSIPSRPNHPRGPLSIKPPRDF